MKMKMRVIECFTGACVCVCVFPAADGPEADGQRSGERKRFLLQQTQRH